MTKIVHEAEFITGENRAIECTQCKWTRWGWNDISLLDPGNVWTYANYVALVISTLSTKNWNNEKSKDVTFVTLTPYEWNGRSKKLAGLKNFHCVPRLGWKDISRLNTLELIPTVSRHEKTLKLKPGNQNNVIYWTKLRKLARRSRANFQESTKPCKKSCSKKAKKNSSIGKFLGEINTWNPVKKTFCSVEVWIWLLRDFLPLLSWLQPRLVELLDRYVS